MTLDNMNGMLVFIMAILFGIVLYLPVGKYQRKKAKETQGDSMVQGVVNDVELKALIQDAICPFNQCVSIDDVYQQAMDVDQSGFHMGDMTIVT